MTPGGELIDLHGGRRRQLAAHDDAGRLQPFQPLGQHIGADPRQVGAKVAEALGAEEQLAHHQQRPPFADEIERMRRPARIFIAAANGLRDFSYLF
jgi:hypothetical protein